LSPSGTFLVPGLALLILGLLLSVALFLGDLPLGRITLSLHTLVFSCSAVTIGLQSIAFWLYAKYVAIDRGLLAPDPLFERLRAAFTFERGVVIGGLFIVLGLAGGVFALRYWSSISFGIIAWGSMMRLVIASATALIIGVQIVFASFFLMLLHYAKTGETAPGRGG
jgi:hypothetical protein